MTIVTTTSPVFTSFQRYILDFYKDYLDRGPGILGLTVLPDSVRLSNGQTGERVFFTGTTFRQDFTTNEITGEVTGFRIERGDDTVIQGRDMTGIEFREIQDRMRAAPDLPLDDIIGDADAMTAYRNYANLWTVDGFVDRITGSRQRDVLEAGGDMSVLRGKGGADVLIAAPGLHTLEGGAGRDAVSFFEVFIGALSFLGFFGLTVELAKALGLATSTEGDAIRIIGEYDLKSIEDVNGSPFDDAITGNGVGNSLFGNGGDDTLSGRDGKDRLFGGAGRDELNGGNDADVAKGGAGLDEIVGGKGNDRLSGGGGRDLIYGGRGNDVLHGNGGGDSLFGGDGSDDLYGGAGRDHLFGGDKTDNLDGGAGDDQIEGGRGNDAMSGGAGADDFHYNGLSPESSGSGADIIDDFELGIDRIVIRNSDPSRVTVTVIDADSRVVEIFTNDNGRTRIELDNLADDTTRLDLLFE